MIKSNIVYAIGSAANSAALFLLIPYLVNTLTPVEYGAWAILEVMIMLLHLLMLLGMDVGMMREYWFLGDDQERKRLVGSVLVAVVLLGGLISVFLVTAYLLLGDLPMLHTWLDDFPPASLLLVILISLVEAVFTIFLSIFRIREEAALYVVVSVGRMFVFLGAAIAGVQILGGLNGALMGRMVAGILATLVALILARKQISLAFKKTWLRKVLNYGLPLAPTALASYILFASDRYVLKYFSTIEIVAIYTFAYKVAATLDIMVNRPYSIDWAARRFKISTEQEAGKKFGEALEFYLFAAGGFSLVVMALTPLVYTWIAPLPYWAGKDIVPIILLAYMIYGVSYPLNVGIMLKDRTSILPVIGWIAALTCLFLNFWLIPQYNMTGAAWATVLAYLVWTGGITWVSLRLYPIAYPLRELALILLAILAGGLGIVLIESLWDTHRIILSSAIKLGWVIILFGGCGYLLIGRRAGGAPLSLGKPGGAGSKQ